MVNGNTNRYKDDTTPSQKARAYQPPITFTFKNIGPITNAELQLGDLTIIAGRNNTGKTYLVYTLYGFLKMSRQMGTYTFGTGPEVAEDYSPRNQIVRDLLTSGRATRTIDSDTFASGRAAMLRHISQMFAVDGLPSVFSHPRDTFVGASIEVHLPHRQPELIQPTEMILPGGGVFSIHYDGAQINASIDKADASHYIFDIQHHVARFFFDFFIGDFPLRPVIFSAERFGISLFYRELDFTKNKLVDMLQRIGDDKDKTRISPYLLIDSTTSRYALPIKDNIDYTRQIPDLRKDKSQVYDDRLFDDIKDMMDGYYGSSEGDIRFISKSRKKRRFNIPLHLASSSARGLSDLYFYLRHAAQKNQLLIVDEPESHLDTANQIQMARLLARFVRSGIKVLITTHSDYLIKEFNNLIMLDNDFIDREIVARKLGYTTRDRLPRRLVKAYVAESNSLKQCKVDNFGIDMPVFDNSIDSINHAANDLASRVEETV